MHYADDPRFRSYVFENSYVLGVHVGIGWAVIELDACLSKDHPDARNKQKPDDWDAFRPAQLWFKGATVEFERSDTPAAIDADDSWDYGELETFQIEGDQYLLEGEFGRLRVISQDVYLKEFSVG